MSLGTEIAACRRASDQPDPPELRILASNSPGSRVLTWVGETRTDGGDQGQRTRRLAPCRSAPRKTGKDGPLGWSLAKCQRVQHHRVQLMGTGHRNLQRRGTLFRQNDPAGLAWLGGQDCCHATAGFGKGRSERGISATSEVASGSWEQTSHPPAADQGRMPQGTIPRGQQPRSPGWVGEGCKRFPSPDCPQARVGAQTTVSVLPVGDPQRGQPLEVALRWSWPEPFEPDVHRRSNRVRFFQEDSAKGFSYEIAAGSDKVFLISSVVCVSEAAGWQFWVHCFEYGVRASRRPVVLVAGLDRN